MGSVGRKAAEARKKRILPNDYVAAKDESNAYLYCVNAGIRISPMGVKDMIGHWHIGISTPDNYRKVYNSPEICDKYSVWQVFYKYCKYYYEKQI